MRADAALKRVADRADLLGLHFDTAVGVVVERELLELELAAWSHGAAARLDERAREARVEVELDAAASSYLAMLGLCNADASEATRPFGGELSCLLPGRLWTRLSAGGAPPVAIRGCLLDDAIAWERAAVLAGFTMTEWALRELLMDALA